MEPTERKKQPKYGPDGIGRRITRYKLTEAQRRFCQLLVFPAPDGTRRSQAKAYFEAYGGNEKRTSIGFKAAKVMRLPLVIEELARLREVLDAQIQERLEYGIAVKANRIAEKIERHALLKRVIAARAEKYKDDPEVPGGATGTQVKRVNVSKRGMITVEYETDNALLRELSNLEVEIAKELGQYTEKTDVTSGGKPIEQQVFILMPDNGRDTNLPNIIEHQPAKSLGA